MPERDVKASITQGSDDRDRNTMQCRKEHRSEEKKKRKRKSLKLRRSCATSLSEVGEKGRCKRTQSRIEIDASDTIDL